jgi:ankyrin repeat protein
MKKVLLITLGLILLASASSFAGPIHDAIIAGDLAGVKAMVADNPDQINAKASDNNTPLHLAAINGHTEIVKFLISRGVDVNIGDNENSPPIVNAALSNHTDIVKLMLDNGASVTQADDNQMTPLHFACMGGDPEIVRMLIDKGADANALNHNGLTPMIYAAYRGKLEAIKVLIEHGADPYIVASDGITNLHGAANFGSVEVCKFFIDLGIDVNVTDNQARTPLFDATSRGRIEVTEYLLGMGADANAIDSNLNVPMHDAAYGGDVDVIDMLVKAGANVNVSNRQSRTPLHFAHFRDQIDAVRALLAHGADPNTQDNNGQTPIFLTTRNGSGEICQTLLDNGADANLAENKNGQTVLHRASIKGQSEIVNHLLAFGSDFNAVDNSGYTPLDYAGKYAHDDVAKILTIKGAKCKKKNKSQDASTLLNKPLANDEAVAWYTGHSGWTIKTKNHLLVFDYWAGDYTPPQPSLSNGFINPDEIRGLPVTVFVSHSHRDHYDPTVFEWKETVPDINYVFGFEPDSATGYEYMAPREEKTFDGVKVTTIESNDSGVGFLVEVDGMVIYHPGDHANRQQDFSGPFKAEIDFLAAKGADIDLTFAPVSGCGFGDMEAVKLGVYYTLKTLTPKIVFPQHASNAEFRYREFADEAADQNFKTKFMCAENKGDRFIYRNGTMAF